MDSKTILISSKLHKGISIHNALVAMKQNSIYWSKEIRSTFDAFKIHKPTVVICDKNLCDSAMKKCLANRPYIQFIYTEDVKDAADSVVHKAGISQPRLECDIAIVGEQPSKIVHDVCYPVGKYKVKVVGGFKWPNLTQYIGPISNLEFDHLCASANFIINFSNNKHLSYNIMYAGGTPILEDTVENRDEFGESGCLFAKTVEDIDQILSFNNHGWRCSDSFIKINTYIERMRGLLQL
jgi:hypothetical protein